MATSDNSIRSTSYNCRGAMSSVGYLDELMIEGVSFEQIRTGVNQDLISLYEDPDDDSA